MYNIVVISFVSELIESWRHMHKMCEIGKCKSSILVLLFTVYCYYEWLSRRWVSRETALGYQCGTDITYPEIVTLDVTKYLAIKVCLRKIVSLNIAENYHMRAFRSFAKKTKIRDYYGSGWVGPGLTEFFLENHPKIALNQC